MPATISVGQKNTSVMAYIDSRRQPGVTRHHESCEERHQRPEMWSCIRTR
jgi:hypothetical protein